MSMSTSISLSQWARLYDAAQKYKTMACWEWMYDSDIFGVQNPLTQEVGYCCIMGRKGEFFAMAVYLGTQGLETINSILSGRLGPGSDDLIDAQNCLMLSFGGREEIEPRDHQVIKQLGRQFRGRTDWPLFRRHKPGYRPWFLASDEVDFLALAIEQAMEVAPRVKDNPDFLISDEKERYLVRVSESIEGNLSWRDEWKKPSALIHKPLAVRVNESLLKQACQAIEQRGGTWLYDLYYGPFTIQETEPHYLPLMSLWMDLDSEAILGFEMTAPDEGLETHAECLLKLVCKSHVCPEKVLVMRERAGELLAPLAKELNFQLLITERLPPLENAKRSMKQFMSRV